jgi:Flp pilus assembly protein TadD
MRNLNWILSAFAGGALLTTIAACEDSQPKSVPQPVKMEAPVAKKIEAPVAQPKMEAPKPEPKIEIKKEEVATVEDEEMKPSEAIAGARDALNQGELDRAIKLARVAVAKSPKRSAAWNTLGRVQLARGERKDARASFEKAVELNPSSSYAQNNLGLTLIYEGKYDEAVDALESAIELEPVESYMYNNLGMAYEHLDRLEEARDAYHKAADLKSKPATENLARLQGVKTVRTAKAESTAIDLPVVSSPDGGEDR